MPNPPDTPDEPQDDDPRPDFARELEEGEDAPEGVLVRHGYSRTEPPRLFLFAYPEQRLPHGWYDTPEELTGGPDYSAFDNTSPFTGKAES